MNTTGLTTEQLELLKQVFKNYAAVESVKLYGSRAKGTFHARSDVDLVVLGQGIDRFLIAQMLLDLEDSDLPYAVDLQNYAELKNLALKEHINRVGILIYEKINLVIDEVKAKIIQIKAKPPYQIYLTMDNGEKLALDLTPLIEKRAAFWRLKNFRYFRQVSVDPLGGLCWTEGEDISPGKIFDYVKDLT